MISTRLHGWVDFGVAALFGGLAATLPLSRSTRRVLGAATAYHTCYSAVTDYEAGLQARIGMRQHLALDLLGAIGLCAAATAQRHRSGADRGLLLAAALTEVAVVAFSSAGPVRGPGQGSGPIDRLLGVPAEPYEVAYPPLDTPKPFAPDVWVVDSTLGGLVGRVLPARMTVIRLPGGDLLLHSPTR